jgi:hypothetical protein
MFNLKQHNASNLKRRLPRLYFGVKHQIIDRFRKQPVLIYQVGKVGSSTILNSLSHYRLGRSVYHIHNLRQEIAQKHLEGTYPVKEVKPRGDFLWDSFYLSRKMALPALEKWPVITLVREPVGRNISAFFQGLDRSHPDLFQEGLTGKLDPSRLQQHFLNEFNHDGLFPWFDHQLKAVLDIDVFAIPSPREKGYTIYENERARILLIRMEDLDSCAPEAFKKFLGIDNFILRRKNISEKKLYKGIYRSFLNDLCLPDFYLDRMYNNRYTSHFYSKAEITAFRNKWRGN